MQMQCRGLAPVGADLLRHVPLPPYTEFYITAIGASPGIRTFARRITTVPLVGSTGTAGEKQGLLAAMWKSCADFCQEESSSKSASHRAIARELLYRDAETAHALPKELLARS